MKIGSLFSGIGGLELGLEWSGIGSTIWQCEIDEFCRGVLRARWPEAELHGDVSTLNPSCLPDTDLICGGFPCQDVSAGGRKAGLAGARSGLWDKFRRIVEAKRPTWCVVENVASGARLWVDAVRGDLGKLSYATLPINLEARWFGAPHVRSRVFIVAHAHGFPLRQLEQWQPGRWPNEVRDGGQTEPGRAGWWGTQPRMGHVGHGLSERLGSYQRRALGNAVMPQMAQVIGRVIANAVSPSTLPLI